MSTTLNERAAQAIVNAEFRSAWPIEVRKVLVKAAKTEGDIPAFAVKQVNWALGQASYVERKMAGQIALGQSLLPQKLRRQLVKAG